MTLVILVFVGTLLIGLPMAFVLGLGGLAHLVAINSPTYFSIITQRLFTGVNTFSLMCIPFFILAGELMNSGGITKRLLDLAREGLGWIRGGMAYCCVIWQWFWQQSLVQPMRLWQSCARFLLKKWQRMVRR